MAAIIRSGKDNDPEAFDMMIDIASDFGADTMRIPLRRWHNMGLSRNDARTGRKMVHGVVLQVRLACRWTREPLPRPFYCIPHFDDVAHLPDDFTAEATITKARE